MQTTVNIAGYDFEVEYTITPGSRGSRDGFGVPLEPDDPGELNIDSITFSGIDITGFVDDLCSSLQDLIYQAVMVEAATQASYGPDCPDEDCPDDLYEEDTPK